MNSKAKNCTTQNIYSRTARDAKDVENKKAQIDGPDAKNLAPRYFHRMPPLKDTAVKAFAGCHDDRNGQAATTYHLGAAKIKSGLVLRTMCKQRSMSHIFYA